MGPILDALFCTDRKGLPFFAVAATSLAINKPASLRRAFLFSTDVSPKDVSKLFFALKKKYGLLFELVPLEDASPQDFPISRHVTVGTYFRLFAGDLLPPDVTRVLYLDIDTVVDKPLHSHLPQVLDQLEQSDAVLAAVSETQRPSHLLDRSITSGPYFQAGVMVIDLTRWRQLANMSTFVKIITKHGKTLKWWDQDVLNIAFEGLWLELPKSWNGTPERRSAATLIYHWAGPDKPWNFRNRVSNRGVWEKYRRLTPALRPPPIPYRQITHHYVSVVKRLIRKSARVVDIRA